MEDTEMGYKCLDCQFKDIGEDNPPCKTCGETYQYFIPGKPASVSHDEQINAMPKQLILVGGFIIGLIFGGVGGFLMGIATHIFG